MNILLRSKELPLVRAFRQRRYEKYFARQSNANLFRGVFASFAEAAATNPGTKPEGYDNADAASMYVERLSRVYTSDYPMLFWLAKILEGGTREIFDFGGHVGIAYYAYGKYLEIPKDTRWTVHDVAAVIRAGRALAAERNMNNLVFAESVADAEGADLFFSSGALQYVESTLAEMLATLAHKPRHLLLNKLPFHQDKDFVTLQNIGTSFCPYRVFRRGDFIESLMRLGYHVVDEWASPESCAIPFFADHSVGSYTGLYLELLTSSVQRASGDADAGPTARAPTQREQRVAQ